MHSIRLPWRGLSRAVALAALMAIAGSGVAPSFAQTPAPPAAAPQNAFRPEIAAPLQAAEELIRARKFDDALAKIRLTDAVPDRTPAENLAIDRMRGIAASGAGDIPTATRSFEAVVAAGRLEPADKARMVEVLAQLHFQAKDYAKAVAWSTQYLKDGGTNPEMRWLLIRSYYLADDCANAARELRAAVDADAKAGTAPQLERLQLLASCYAKLGDNAGSAFALEKMLVYHPSREFWAEAIRRVETGPGFAERLQLDLLRLRQATGTLRGTADYGAMSQLALAAGLPAEAKRISDQGFAAGLLGTGAEAEQQRRLRDTAAKQMAEDEKQLPLSAKAAGAAPDGTALVNVGFAYASAGRYDNGLALMEQGMKKGGLKRPDDAKLHLAIAYLGAG